MSSNEPRDQLAADLMAYAWSDHGLRSAHNEHRFEATCAICTANVEAVSGAVTALGWRPPPRVIETVADLFALPDETMLRTRLGYAAIMGTHPEHGRGAYMTNLEGLRMLSDNDLPVTVLWDPRRPAVAETKGCTCDLATGCGEGAEAGCMACSKDVYAPCLVFGFMCGLPDDPPCECCTPEQQEMTRRFYTPQEER